MRRQYRLASSRSFDYLYKHGSVFKNALLVLYVAKSKLADPKVGFSVGKKVGGNVGASLGRGIIGTLFKL